MKKWKPFLLFSVIFIILCFLPMHYFLPRIQNYSGNYDLAPKYIDGVSTYLFFGETFVLDVSVQGANGDIYFYITDQFGNSVFDAGTVYNEYHLELTLTKSLSGRYIFNFDNSMSLVSHKNVDFTLQIFPYPLVFIIVSIILAIITVALFLKEERVAEKLKKLTHKNKESTENTCEYCNTEYSKQLDKCPNCGATKKKQ